MTGQKKLKDTYRRIIEAVGADDPGALDRLVAPNIVDHNPLPNQAPGRDGFKQWMGAVRTAFPDLEGTVEDVLAEGDRVAARVTWQGTHRGEFACVSPTSKSVSFAGFHIVRFAGGRAVDWWGTADLLGALHQIGATVSGPQSP